MSVKPGQISKILFPIGELENQVRYIAKKQNLITVEKEILKGYALLVKCCQIFKQNWLKKREK